MTEEQEADSARALLWAGGFMGILMSLVAWLGIQAEHHPVPPPAGVYYCLKQSWEAVADFGICREREPESMPL